MKTSMTRFRWPFKNVCVLVLWRKVASAFRGLSQPRYAFEIIEPIDKHAVYGQINLLFVGLQRAQLHVVCSV